MIWWRSTIASRIVLAAQVEHAVLQADHLVDRRVLVDGNGGVSLAARRSQRAHVDLDLAGRRGSG